LVYQRNSFGALSITSLWLVFATVAAPSACLADPKQTFISDVTWSIAHEGCKIFHSSRPGARADALKSASDLRACYLDSQSHNPGVLQTLRAASDSEILAATRDAAANIPITFHLAESFEWLLAHEGLLDVVKELDRAGHFTEIRSLYATHQARNPNARNLLDAVCDSELHNLINRPRVTVFTGSDTPPDALARLAALTVNGLVVTTAPTDVRTLAAEAYGSATDALVEVLKRANVGLLAGPASTMAANPRIGAQAQLVVPLLPRPNTATVLALRDGVSAADVQQALKGTPGLTYDINDIYGTIEEPVRGKDATLLSLPPSGTEYSDWYAKPLHLHQISRFDISGLANEVVVGVIDGGVDSASSGLGNSLWKVPFGLHDNEWVTGAIGYDYLRRSPNPYDEMPDSHGTHVTGIVVARPLLYAKSVPDDFDQRHSVKVATLKIAGKDKQFAFTAAENAIYHAVNKGIHLFNLSFKGPFSEVLHSFVAGDAWRNTNLFVVAAGNDSTNLDEFSELHRTFREDRDDKRVLRALPNVIFVAAINDNGKLAAFSNYGREVVQIAAPGVQIPSTLRGGAVGPLTGTSMAAPLVTMTIALILAQRALPIPDLKRRLLVSCDLDPSLEDAVADGCVLNVAKALALRSDLVELKTGELLRGLVDPAQLSLLDPKSNSPHPADSEPQSLLRIWVRDDARTTVVTVSDKRPDGSFANPSIAIHLDDGSSCPYGSNLDPCVLPSTIVRDIVFRQR